MRFLPKAFCVCFLLCSSIPTIAQKSDLEFGLYNIGLNSVIGGVGALINKEKEESFKKVLLKGLGQGAIGGYLIFESKRLVREFSRTDNFLYVWPSKLVNSAGTSIVDNAASNRNFWEKWHLTIGFTRLELNTLENYRLSLRINPTALAGTILTATKGKLEVQKSLKTGNLVFSTNELQSETGFSYGRTSMIGNTILLLDTWEGDIALAHEIIHTYQNASFTPMNSYLNKPIRSVTNRSNFWNTYNKYFYSDVSPLFIYILYNASGTGEKKYKKNIFEEEAFYFSSNTFINPIPPVLLGY